MARQLATNNAPLIANHAENRVDMGAVDNAEGVRMAVITDLENRVIAPVSKQNQYLTSGNEALLATKARDLFRTGRETGFIADPDSDSVVAIEPVKVYNQASGKNATIGMAIVSIDTSIATLGFGDIGLVYSETMILTALLGALTLFILYRLTLKPMQVLNEDMDKALKGDITQVTQEFKFEELNPLWDLINSALQRIPKSGSFAGAKSEPTISAEDFAAPLRALGSFGKMGVVIFDGDRKIVSLNSFFEEISGRMSLGSLAINRSLL
jgi:methyl-accepting chemotaxis protein